MMPVTGKSFCVLMALYRGLHAQRQSQNWVFEALKSWHKQQLMQNAIEVGLTCKQSHDRFSDTMWQGTNKQELGEAEVESV